MEDNKNTYISRTTNGLLLCEPPPDNALSMERKGAMKLLSNAYRPFGLRLLVDAYDQSGLLIVRGGDLVWFRGDAIKNPAMQDQLVVPVFDGEVGRDRKAVLVDRSLMIGIGT